LNSASHYDVVIIGAGVSGLAAGIRLAHFGQRVCIFERHNAIGGLNGFYSLDGRKYDVGLHAVTNFVPEGTKGTPLGKILRQLRIERDEFALCPQIGSRVAFGGRGEHSLRFTNDFAVLEAEVARLFPRQIDGFRRVAAYVRDQSLAGEGTGGSARAFLRERIGDPLLEDMILCPLMFYGSARENDIELGQFAIMFRALYLEGFARPLEGVRRMLRVLADKYRAAGGERRMKCGVLKIRSEAGRAVAVVLDNGEEVAAKRILSSAGWEETNALLDDAATADGGEDRPASRSEASVRKLGFVETITVLRETPARLGWGDDTIVFFNDSERFSYEQPADPVDVRSGIICFPNNFDYGPGQSLSEGFFRCTCLARPDKWIGIAPEVYAASKQKYFGLIQASARRFLPPLAPPDRLERATVATDMFTPRTVEHFTGHRGGAIYGAPDKHPDGHTRLPNLFVCGTDQGMLGIVGAMLSGISIANRHLLQGSGPAV